MTVYGPNNPHPLSRMKTELVWEGKYNEFGNRREVNVAALAMPLQRIETIDEPRSRAEEQGSLFDANRAHRDDYRNCLIWGDNKLALASLLHNFRGSIDLVYIDPPFDVGADFKVDITLGDGTDAFTKEQSIMEMVAYRDIWGRGSSSYIEMLYERLIILRDLLADTESIFVHCDWRVNSFVRALMDEVFGSDAFVNEVIWKRAQTVKGNFGQGTQAWGANVDTLYFYRKGAEATFNPVFTPYSSDYIEKFYRYKEPDGRRYRLISMIGPGGAAKGNPRYEVMGVTRYWRYSQERMKKLIADDMVVQTSSGTVPQRKQYLNEDSGVPLQTLWDDIGGISAGSAERVDYPTQKPEALLDRMLRSCTEEDDLVLDAFCGSGTTLAVAEKLGRRWM